MKPLNDFTQEEADNILTHLVNTGYNLEHIWHCILSALAEDRKE
ncbi:MAG: hypothetical protein R8M45_05435 [Ghiorsea sp.]